MRLLHIIFFLLISLSIFPQKVVRTSGSAQLELTMDKSRAQVNEEVKDMAIINAIERAFGRVIIQGNTTYISNVTTGQETESNIVFNMIANTSVKGELVEVLELNYSDIKGNKKINGNFTEIIEIKCDVLIKAREIEEASVNFETSTLVCPKVNCKTTTFENNDDFFLHFLSPQSGYVTVYLDDTENSYRLLPYKDMPAKYESGFPVKADRDYIFFSIAPQHNYLNFEWNEDTYQLYAEKKQDINRVFVIYSKDPINKPRLHDNLNQEAISEKEKKAGYSSPKALPSEDFQRWLNKIRSYEKENMQVAIIDITINK
jgi:hypothetical protein